MEIRFKKNCFIPFLVLGDPCFEQSIKLIKTLIDNGCGALELGFAFSDPIADGPIIQKANLRVIKTGFNVENGFEILKKVREYSDIPISLMLCYNLIFKYGIDRFYKKCDELKIDAILVPDCPLEESDELIYSANKYNLNQVFLVSENSDDSRLSEINKKCSGYVYLVSILGTTGIREDINHNLGELIERVKKNINKKVYVGFGISKPDHVKDIIQLGADGAISGSAICKLVEDNLYHYENMAERIGKFCKDMSDSCL
jgi:tryptophan synthase alpha chain